MYLRCQNCGRVYPDPGGDIGRYYCIPCGSRNLQRMPENRRNDPAIGAVSGAIIGGLAFGPPGAIIGGILGLILGGSSQRRG